MADVTIRELERVELAELWTIDRAERIESVYRVVGGELVRVPEVHDMRGWPPGEPEHYAPLLLDCVDHGGAAYGAFDDGVLVGGAVLEARFIGRARDQLQLKFLHVSHARRRSGLGRALFDRVVSKAQLLGARRLYVSATSSENTVDFYLRRGCRLAQVLDPALYALEPEDVHLEFEIPEAGSHGTLR